MTDRTWIQNICSVCWPLLLRIEYFSQTRLTTFGAVDDVTRRHLPVYGVLSAVFVKWFSGFFMSSGPQWVEFITTTSDICLQPPDYREKGMPDFSYPQESSYPRRFVPCRLVVVGLPSLLTEWYNVTVNIIFNSCWCDVRHSPCHSCSVAYVLNV